uniref:Uncharacterized protein n=1 Tax=Anguilla anguilla TaxID=7936 RepID=A0A0E9XXP2_ANGAN
MHYSLHCFTDPATPVPFCVCSVSSGSDLRHLCVCFL